jgi:Tfp pilus assembly protein PilO
MSVTETGERRAGLKTLLLDRLHDPLHLRLLVMGAVLLAGYSGIYVPLHAQIDEKSKKIAAAQKLADLATGLEQSQAQSRNLAKWLPQHSDAKEWLQYMHEGIRRFPIKLTKLETLAPRQVGPYRVIAFHVEVEGTFHNLDQTLRWLESNHRLLRVDNLNITPAMAKDVQGNLVMKLLVLGLAG